MQIIPLLAVPSQTLNVQLAGQNVTLAVYQKAPALFMDIFLNNAPMLYGCICENLNRIVRSAYLGFVGDLIFIDNQGSTDPIYTGLGARYSLAYLEAADLELLGFAG